MSIYKSMIKRYIKTVGISALIILVLQIIFSLLQNVMQIYLPAYLIEQITGDIFIDRLMMVGVIYFVVLISNTYFTGTCNKMLFKYRLKEIGNVYLSCFNVPVQDIENDKGKAEIERALYAVANGNEIGIEAHLSGMIRLVTNILMLFVYLYMGRELPLFVFGIFFATFVLSIPLEQYLNGIESKELTENQYLKNQQERFRRCCINEKFLKQIRIVSGVRYISEKLNTFSEKNIVYTKKRGKRRMIRASQTSCIHVFRDIVIGIYIIKNIESYTIAQIILYINLFVALDHILNSMLGLAAEIKENGIVVKDFITFIEKYENNTKSSMNPISIESVRFENVYFAYENGNDIIENLSFEIKRGDKVAIVGANGQGKTTLVKLLMGVYAPTKGNIYINDINITNIENDDYQSSIAALFQENPMFAFSLLENITCESSEYVDFDRVQNIIHRASMSDIIDEMQYGIDSMYSNYFSENGVFLSGGQLQRIYMARMFYKDGDLYILDEPTASLDPNAEVEVYNMYDKLLSNKITVFISHRLGSTRFCNKILYLDNKNTKIGTFEELYKDCEKFRDMYNKQKEYYNEEHQDEKNKESM